MKNSDYIYIGVGVLAIGGIIYAVNKNSNSNSTPIINENNVVNETVPLPPAINKDLLLQKGSKGLEVKELQKLMGISADGIFGTQTETVLKKLKGVVKTTLNQYKSLPTINVNSLPIGTNVMGNVKTTTGVKTTTPVYNAIKKADGSYYSDYSIIDNINYGQKVGKIIGSNSVKTWYLIEIEGLFTNRIAFVKALDVAKI